MRFIELNSTTLADTDRRPAPDFHTDTDEPGEGAAPSPEVVRTKVVSINAEAVRCFYPRKDNQPGTRLTFTDGGSFAVIEPYDQVKALITSNGRAR